MNKFVFTTGALALTLLAGKSLAWDYDGHRLVNQLALASLPTNFPAFVADAAAKERIAFLAGEPDRWRNTPDLSLKHCNAPDHYLDIDDLPVHGLEPASLSPFRYEFTAQILAARAAHADKFPPIDPAKDADRTKALVGFLPWTITEQYAKLKSAFSYLKALEAEGTPEEVGNAHQNIIYLMGVMGHFVGDGAQPLHTTKHFNGWVGDNPRGYTTNKTFHAWIDGGYVQRSGLKREDLFSKVRPARLVSSVESQGIHTNVFPVVMTYLLDQFKLVGPLYELEKEGKLSSTGEVSRSGHDFIAAQMVKGGQMLGDLWLTAWHYAPPDIYLKAQLAKRKLAQEKALEPAKP